MWHRSHKSLRLTSRPSVVIPIIILPEHLRQYLKTQAFHILPWFHYFEPPVSMTIWLSFLISHWVSIRYSQEDLETKLCIIIGNVNATTTAVICHTPATFVLSFVKGWEVEVQTSSGVMIHCGHGPPPPKYFFIVINIPTILHRRKAETYRIFHSCSHWRTKRRR